jgi:hypothetical protein
MRTFIQKTFDKIMNFAQKEDPAKVLTITGAIGWVLSCMAYTGAIVLNKEIPEDQKKFLVPHELTDGVINTSLFLLFTSKATTLGKNLIEKGKIFPKALEKTITELKANYGKDFDIKKIGKYLTKPEDIKKLTEFKSSFPVLLGLTGSVIASNIVTPIGRNIVASKFQKHHIKHDSIEAKDNPTIAEQPKPKNHADAPLHAKPYPIHPSGKIKI